MDAESDPICRRDIRAGAGAPAQGPCSVRSRPGFVLLRASAALLLALASTGCFAWVRSVQTAVVCKPEAARSAGREDALAGDPVRDDYASMCGVAEESLNRMYQEAYEAVDEQSRGSRRGLLRRVF